MHVRGARCTGNAAGMHGRRAACARACRRARGARGRARGAGVRGRARGWRWRVTIHPRVAISPVMHYLT
ncbi:hypothetical protein CRG98_048974 [Punica granatum]|uniref:Uncharacterized protein n=1 Tax=Punica granatum TaxID=22663 RepID=A0A2I0HG24_PUNGR|nr:hypothetical protein CRG98_048974 [Punica granatum]